MVVIHTQLLAGQAVPQSIALQEHVHAAAAVQVGRGGELSIPVSDKEAGELEELLQLFELGLGESTAFAAALQVNRCR